MKKILLFFLLMCFGATFAWGVYAPRPMAMGGAYTAVADDAYAPYWNPAGTAINPGINIAAAALTSQRNQSIGDNLATLKLGFETELSSPFEWIIGVGAASAFALESAKYLSDQGVIKKNWGREGEVSQKEEAQKEGDQTQASFSRKEAVKKGLKELLNAGAHVSDKFAHDVSDAVKHSTTNVYFYVPLWYQPNYYRPNIWDDRYNYPEKELTPKHKAQFGAGATWLSDRNDSLNQETNFYTLTLATAWEEIVSVGANLNVYDVREISTNVRGLGAGFDLGGLIRFSDKIFFGLNAKEILTTDIHWQDNRTPTRYNMEVNFGAALKPIRQLTLAADVQNIFFQNNLPQTMHYGFELRPVYGLALRGGLCDSNKTAGVGIGLGDFVLDYVYLGGAYNRTQMAGLTWSL